MPESNIWSVTYDLNRLIAKADELEADIASDSARLSAMREQIHSLANSLAPTLEKVGAGRIVVANEIAVWLDPEDGPCYERVLSNYDVERMLLAQAPAAVAPLQLSEQQLAELAFQQAVADMEAGEDEPDTLAIERLENGSVRVAGVIVP